MRELLTFAQDEDKVGHGVVVDPVQGIEGVDEEVRQGRLVVATSLYTSRALLMETSVSLASFTFSAMSVAVRSWSPPGSQSAQCPPECLPV